ncbi:MAG: hypothetical protein JW797_00085 [Bradymonadales bacterium]|nr:hypothetical protein [Bradymonadales bacterium]
MGRSLVLLATAGFVAVLSGFAVGSGCKEAENGPLDLTDLGDSGPWDGGATADGDLDGNASGELADLAGDGQLDPDLDRAEVIEPQRQTVGRFTLVWLSGTPYEMGYQHGELLYEELAAAMVYLQEDPTLSSLESLARTLGILDLAYANSYPDTLEECQGLADAAQGTGFTLDLCLALSFGDVLVEFVLHGFPAQPGCVGIAATGPATPDGRLYHARNMDWDEIRLLLDYPVLFIRQPSDGIAHVGIGFPGNVTPYQGLNAAGISAQSNEIHPLDNRYHDRLGRSHTQMLMQILKRAHSLDEATELVSNEDHMTCEAFLVADGPNRQAAVFEMNAQMVAIRQLSDEGTLYLTNHFVAPETADTDQSPTSENNLLRYQRLRQLVDPDGDETLYGHLGPAGLIAILRDRINPFTGLQSPADIFADDLSLATTGSLYQVIFDPERLLFWVAAGEVPVPRQKYVGFSLGQLLGLPDAYPVRPPEFPAQR